MFMPGLEKKTLNREDLKDAFESFGIGLLTEVDHAQGIEVLTKEMIGDRMFFAAISVKKMAVLRASDGKYICLLLEAISYSKIRINWSC